MILLGFFSKKFFRNSFKDFLSFFLPGTFHEFPVGFHHRDFFKKPSRDFTSSSPRDYSVNCVHYPHYFLQRFLLVFFSRILNGFFQKFLLQFIQRIFSEFSQGCLSKFVYRLLLGCIPADPRGMFQRFRAGIVSDFDFLNCLFSRRFPGYLFCIGI